MKLLSCPALLLLAACAHAGNYVYMTVHKDAQCRDTPAHHVWMVSNDNCFLTDVDNVTTPGAPVQRWNTVPGCDKKKMFAGTRLDAPACNMGGVVLPEVPTNSCVDATRQGLGGLRYVDCVDELPEFGQFAWANVPYITTFGQNGQMSDCWRLYPTMVRTIDADKCMPYSMKANERRALYFTCDKDGIANAKLFLNPSCGGKEAYSLGGTCTSDSFNLDATTGVARQAFCNYGGPRPPTVPPKTGAPLGGLPATLPGPIPGKPAGGAGGGGDGGDVSDARALQAGVWVSALLAALVALLYVL